ncbi:DUF1697 domain-containing protein [Deinococcus psychrotolerans]|uniref:DUF1697 domain-containing protein n=1 Tax=Deinococcus psychrotolerans TaxID=2489213 RepID=A0A3G8Y8F9_9DEIO|nr:DUF1697 domain-containing protein [Deinococcus psychrotolerans]AZI41659.1 DUF1697 domain-containing protein [Deinococcus psychrotolerans]
MPTVALLRGINVGGNRKVPMIRLKAVAQSLGLTKVQTYIQSGNLVFEGQVSRSELEAAIEREFGFAVPVTLRSAEDWQAVTLHNPYLQQAEADGSKVHVTFLDAEPSEAGLAALRAVNSGADEWTHDGLHLYLHTPGGLGHSKLNPDKLKVGATTRNWRTVLKLSELAGI